MTPDKRQRMVERFQRPRRLRVVQSPAPCRDRQHTVNCTVVFLEQPRHLKPFISATTHEIYSSQVKKLMWFT